MNIEEAIERLRDLTKPANWRRVPLDARDREAIMALCDRQPIAYTLKGSIQETPARAPRTTGSVWAVNAEGSDRTSFYGSKSEARRTAINVALELFARKVARCEVEVANDMTIKILIEEKEPASEVPHP